MKIYGTQVAKISIFQIDTLAATIKLSGKRVAFFLIVSVLASLFVFVMDVLFAILLQRFFTSVDLVKGVEDTRFLGAIKSPQFEGLFLFFVGISRFALLGINSILASFALSHVEQSAKSFILRASLGKMHGNRGRVMHLFGEISSGISYFIFFYSLFLSRFVILILLFIALFIYSWQITLVLVFLAAVVSMMQASLNTTIDKQSLIALNWSRFASESLHANLKNALYVSLRGLRSRELTHIDDNLHKVKLAKNISAMLITTRTLLPPILGIATVVLVAASSLSSTFDNKSEVIPFLYLLLRLFQNLGEFSRASSAIRIESLKVKELLNWAKPSPGKSLDLFSSIPFTFISPPGFKAHGLEFSWESDSKKIKFPNFTIVPGTINLISGPTGSGKSSLLFLLTGLNNPISGEIEVFFRESKSHKRNRRVSGDIGYIGTDPMFVSGTIRDNLYYGIEGNPSDSISLDVLQKVGFEFRELGKEILNLPIGEAGEGLSTGQKQKLAWARALLLNPKLLILDEATSNLDLISKTTLMNLLRELKGTCTILLVDHNFDSPDLIDGVFLKLSEL